MQLCFIQKYIQTSLKKTLDPPKKKKESLKKWFEKI